MEIKDVNVWKPIGFDENWEKVSTSRLDVLLPSWVHKRQTLKDDSREYGVFMDRLKRQHAIETGIVERLYDLSEGITETFIKEGFVESYLQHGDTNIPTGQLMDYLQDNFDALDFVFDIVKNDRPITKGFIKELHQLVTKHQHTAEGRDQFGNRLQIPLLKGSFKERENNPTRADGTRFLYCSPIHVESEMDRLVSILDGLEKRKIKPLVIATWLHHAFTQIHPFQDGNGRMARLLASLILIKGGLFPLTVKRNEKKRYIDSLELADNGEPQKLVDYFGEIQKRNIEAALNMRLEVELSETSFAEMANLFAKRLELEKEKLNLEYERQEKIKQYKLSIYKYCSAVIEKIKEELELKINGNASVNVEEMPFHFKTGGDKAAINIAKQFKYFYNDKLTVGKIVLKMVLANKNIYNVIISIHHYGYSDSTLAIGSIIGLSEGESAGFIPIDLEPYLISLEGDFDDIRETIKKDINVYIKNLMTLALAQITTELN
ncbi:MAG: Fic family protein [Saprospiraceae bacterium]